MPAGHAADNNVAGKKKSRCGLRELEVRLRGIEDDAWGEKGKELTPSSRWCDGTTDRGEWQRGKGGMSSGGNGVVQEAG